jgi:hypothetical protein
VCKEEIYFMEPTRAIIGRRKQRQGTLTIFCAVVGIIGVSGHEVATGGEDKRGAARGETSQQIGQQGLGVDGGASSPILAGPEIIIGSIKKIQGEEYTIEGDGGQNVRIRVTTDTNKVCPSGGQAHVSSGQEGVREHAEIPPTPSMQQRSSEQKGQSRRADQADRQDLQKHATAPPSRDPSQMKATVGSTDQRANEDVARGSGFAVGQCAFKEGDQVRVEASDMGTATTIKQLLSSRSGQ